MFPVRRLIERRPVILAAALLWCVAVALLHRVLRDPNDAISLLYAVPVALTALELGTVAGLAAAGFATALVVASWLAANETLDLLAILTRTLVLFAIGATAGRFSDRMREAQERQRLLLRSGLTLTELTGVDELPAVIAGEARRLLSTDDVRVDVGGAVPDHQDPPGAGRSDHVFELAVRGTRYGTLSVNRSRPLSDDDRAVLAILALQAAVAAENVQLLDRERDRANVRAELNDARVRLADRADQLREVIGRQEAERDHVAYELHEQAAQMLAAVLLGLARLDAQLQEGEMPGGLSQLRTDLGTTLSSLRGLAKSLRPSVLTLGLGAGLEQIAEAAQARGLAVRLEVAGTEGLDEQTARLVYRAVEEALVAVPAAESLSLRTRANDSELVVELRARDGSIDPGALAILRARIELLGGTTHADRESLRAVIPLPRVAPDPLAETAAASTECSAAADESG